MYCLCTFTGTFAILTDNRYLFVVKPQVFPIEHLQVFTAEELERLICGEHDSWAVRVSVNQLIYFSAVIIH